MFFGLALFGLFTFVYSSNTTKGYASRFSSEVLNLIDRSYSDELHRKKSICHNYGEDIFIKGCLWGANDSSIIEPEYALVGDSHAESLVAALSDEFLNNKKKFIQYTKDACPSLFLEIKTGNYQNQNCESYSLGVLEDIKNRNIKKVILHARWRWYVEGLGFDNGLGGSDGPHVRVFAKNTDNSSKTVMDALNKLFLEYLKLEDVILIYDTPEFGWNTFTRLIKSLSLGHKIKSDIPADLVKKRLSLITNNFDSINPNNHTIHRVYPQNVFCNTYLKNECIAWYGDAPLFLDSNHLSNLGAKFLLENQYKW
jgi:hypothetical protein